MDGHFYYYKTISNKRPSSKMTNKNAVTHKLPAEISRYLLIYDIIGMKYIKGRDKFVFSTNKNENNVNQEFFETFADIFKLSSTCTCLVMRHLYTSICNYIFPNNAYTDSSILSTIGCIAEMSGHSAETHDQHYSSSISKEFFFNKYHQSIGTLFSMESNEIKKGYYFVKESEMLKTLQITCGLNVNFLSDLQKNMIMDSGNNVSHHTFCGIGCGGGKSMAWILSAFSRSLNGNKNKMHIVILPYCFLLQHHYSSCKTLVGIHQKFDIEYLRGRDIHDNILPNILRDQPSLPTILFLSLEAISLLLKHHFNFMEELVSGDLIHKIYMDECHTILSENNFRKSYSCLSKLSLLKIPVMNLSGSFPKHFINGYMDFMHGTTDMESYNFFIDDNIFGKKLLKVEYYPSATYVKDTCYHVSSYVTRNPESNVHIIVSTVNEGKWCGSQFYLSLHIRLHIRFLL